MKIEKRHQAKWSRLQPERRITEFLQCVPSEHLVGLGKVVLLEEATSTVIKNAEVRGRYIHKKGKELPYIEIALGNIFRGVPKILLCMPLFSRWQLASVLYHEIGHHYGASLHGMDAKRREAFANQYRKKMMVEAFRSWYPLLLPCKPAIHLARWVLSFFRNKQMN